MLGKNFSLWYTRNGTVHVLALGGGMMSGKQLTQGRSQGGAKGAFAPPFFPENLAEWSTVY